VIHGGDCGEGIVEGVLAEQLTRMFASTKEDALTKIGKFGIGFTAIFAIHPEAVLLQTGRHGENWELLFHPDRSFDKVRIQQPIDGTRITLFRRMDHREVEKFIRECRWILRYWCEHSDTPVTFWDRTDEESAEVVDESDPFAAFADDPDELSATPMMTTSSADCEDSAVGSHGPQLLTRPLDLTADLLVELHEDGVQAMVGYSAQPRFGFYNGGLTLLNTRSAETLGEYAERLGHLTIKVKSDALEHTLTRDNVIQDAHWHRVMRVVLRAARQLQETLLETLASAAREGASIRPWLRYLAGDCDADPDLRQIEGLWRRIVMHNHRGDVVTLEEIDEQMHRIGAVLLAPKEPRLLQALDEKSLIVLPDWSEIRELLRTAPQDGLFVRQTRQITKADRVFVLPDLVEADTLHSQEREMLQRCEDLIRAAVGHRISVRVGNYGGASSAIGEALALDGPAEGGLFVRPERGRFRWPLFLKRRCLLINRHHPFYQAQLIAFTEQPTLAAYGLASALLHEDGLQRDRIFGKLLEAAAQEIVPR